MKRFTVFTLVFLSLLFFESASAVIYQYVDDNGDTCYTNDLSSVPADKLDQLVEIEEAESAPVTTRRSYSGPTYPRLNNTQAEDRKKQQKRKEEKEQLEAEYAALLKEKEAMDNDESFQKRRNKRKYQNRPYIKALVAREVEINERLQILEGMLKAYE
jgi:hypothetical protein